MFSEPFAGLLSLARAIGIFSPYRENTYDSRDYGPPTKIERVWLSHARAVVSNRCLGHKLTRTAEFTGKMDKRKKVGTCCDNKQVNKLCYFLGVDIIGRQG